MSRTETVVCDKCGKVISNSIHEILITNSLGIEVRHDICHPCNLVLNRWFHAFWDKRRK